MKYIKSLLIINIMIFSMNSVLATEIKLSDIEKHWAKNAIEKFVANSVVNGYEDNTFKPDESINVAEFLKMITSAGKYDLVREGDKIWPDFYINTAIKNKLITDNMFKNFEQPITREEACKVIANFIDVSEIKASKNKFKDVSGDYEEDVLKLVNLNVISGYKDKTFRGENLLTRAEAVTIIERALTKRDTLIKNRKYQIDDAMLSNYKTNNCYENNIYDKTRYEVVDGNLCFFDTGRYANLDGYKFSGEVIDVSKILKTITSLINEKAYVAVLYQPSKYTINQLQILYGDSSEKLSCGEYDFSITFFENDFYELSRISMEDKFSNKVFVKVEVAKLWDEFAEFREEKTVDAFKKSKFKNAISAICKSDSEKISNYIIQKYSKCVKEKMGEEIKEHKVFNNYIVDLYKKENGVLTFYISER